MGQGSPVGSREMWGLDGQGSRGAEQWSVSECGRRKPLAFAGGLGVGREGK